jgi:hypothetical protein
MSRHNHVEQYHSGTLHWAGTDKPSCQGVGEVQRKLLVPPQVITKRARGARINQAHRAIGYSWQNHDGTWRTLAWKPAAGRAFMTWLDNYKQAGKLANLAFHDEGLRWVDMDIVDSDEDSVAARIFF